MTELDKSRKSNEALSRSVVEWRVAELTQSADSAQQETFTIQ